MTQKHYFIVEVDGFNHRLLFENNQVYGAENLNQHYAVVMNIITRYLTTGQLSQPLGIMIRKDLNEQKG